MSDFQRTDDKLYDPDPWVLISLAITAVATVAQLASLALQVQGRESKLEYNINRHKIQIQNITNSLEEVIMQVERLVRLLSSASSIEDSALKAIYRFGECRLKLGHADLDQYKKICSELALKTSALTAWVVSLIERDEAFAALLGRKILNKFSHIQVDINEMALQKFSNEMVLEKLLYILREFHIIMDQIQSKRN